MIRMGWHNNFKKEKPQKVKSLTETQAIMSSDFLTKYEMANTLKKLKGHNINSFLQIGLEDPWPDDEKKFKGSLDDVDPSVY